MALYREAADTPRTAGDAMCRAIPGKPAGYIMGKVVNRIQFNGSSKYHYCPYCMKRIRRMHLDYKAELEPLMRLTVKELWDAGEGRGIVTYDDDVFECSVCKNADGSPRRLTTEDFYQVYCVVKPKPRRKFIDLNNPQELADF